MTLLKPKLFTKIAFCSVLFFKLASLKSRIKTSLLSVPVFLWQLGMILQRLTQITPDGYLPVLRDMKTEYATHKWWNFRQL